MAFQPELFLQSAEQLAKGSTEADHRTAGGRAYYAVYGFITQKMAGVRGVRRSRLFGKSGKHGYLKGQIALTNPFKRIATRYNSLLAYRANADYVYEGPKFTKRHAEGAVKDAKAVLAKLNDFEDEDFKNLRGPKGE